MAVLRSDLSALMRDGLVADDRLRLHRLPNSSINLNNSGFLLGDVPVIEQSAPILLLLRFYFGRFSVQRRETHNHLMIIFRRPSQ
jgi:hypothetical protein